VAPHSAVLDRRFRAALKKRGYDPIQQAALCGITPGEAARVLASGAPAGAFFEQVEYNGRRLAKFNVSPGAIAQALSEHDALLSPILQALGQEQASNLRWVLNQLRFCVILTLNNAFYQVREAETQAFYDLFHGELASRSLEDLLRQFLDTMLRFCRADEAHLFLLDKNELIWVPKASSAAVPAPVADSRPLRRSLSKAQCGGASVLSKIALDPAWKGNFATCWSMPLMSGGKVAGVMQFAFKRTYEWLPRERELLVGAAERCVLAAEKAQLIEDLASREEQIRQLGEHMLHVEEIERQRISRELHDEAGQSLLCIRLQLEVLGQSAAALESGLDGKLAEIREMTERTIVEIRRLIRALSPSVLEQFGLGAAIRQLVHNFHQVHPARVRLQALRLGPLPKQTEMIVYRLIQECFNNIAKHSAATTVNISLSTADRSLRLEIDDNGAGFQIDAALAKQNSFGLAGMRERVALLGGRFELESRQAGRVPKAQSGTRICIQLPVPPARA
jgi:signal transduction histidine kinase